MKIMNSQQYQKGAVLLWGMVFLLTMTVLGLVATRMSGTDIRIAGNQMQSMLVYQVAESTLQETTNMESRNQVAQTPDGVLDFGPYQTEISGGKVISTSKVTMRDRSNCPPGISANSMEQNSTSRSCPEFRVEVRAWIPGSGSVSSHVVGVLGNAPPNPSKL